MSREGSKRLLRPSTIAKSAGVGIRVVYRWIESGELTAKRVNGRYYVRADVWEAFLARFSERGDAPTGI